MRNWPHIPRVQPWHGKTPLPEDIEKERRKFLDNISIVLQEDLLIEHPLPSRKKPVKKILHP